MRCRWSRTWSSRSTRAKAGSLRIWILERRFGAVSFTRDRNGRAGGKHGRGSRRKRSRGGRASWVNIVCACVKCNVRKGGRTPWEAGIRLIKEPIEPKTSPVLSLKLAHRKYWSWKTFLDNAYWSVELH